jgi:trans-2,3-dihydro-3-hydroxyanthranilate isomerase
VIKLSYTLVDVFTDRALAGNPLAVFTDGSRLSSETMQALASELNLSETTFLLRAEGDATARVRIFTPRRELPFAGHPIVGTAYVIARGAPLHTIRLETGVGPLDVEIEREGNSVVRCVMTQLEPSFAPYEDADGLAAALGTPLVGEPVVGDNGIKTLIAPVADVSGLEPDLVALARIDVTTISCFAPPADGVVPTRVFAPAVGVPEDPATGSAAGPLAVHVVRRGLLPAGRVVVRQGVEMGRPSRMEVDVEPGRPPRVGGGCVAVARGTFEI